MTTDEHATPAHQGGHSIERSNVFFRALISSISVTIRYTFILNKPVILAKVLWESHRICDFFDERYCIMLSMYYRGSLVALHRQHQESTPIHRQHHQSLPNPWQQKQISQIHQHHDLSTEVIGGTNKACQPET